MAEDTINDIPPEEDEDEGDGGVTDPADSDPESDPESDRPPQHIAQETGNPALALPPELHEIGSVNPESVVRDEQGRITSYVTTTGHRVELTYGDDGNLDGWIDTQTGMRMKLTEKGWQLQTREGTKIPLNDVQIDQETGDMTFTMENGFSTTLTATGETVIKNEDGQVLLVVGGNGWQAIGLYGDDRQLVMAFDGHGNQYFIDSNGDWHKRDQSGKITEVNGSVVMTDHGPEVVPVKPVPPIDPVVPDLTPYPVAPAPGTGINY